MALNQVNAKDVRNVSQLTYFTLFILQPFYIDFLNSILALWIPRIKQIKKKAIPLS